MPVEVKKDPKGGSKPWKIVEKSTGKTKGRSETKEKAQASARARNAASHGWKPTKKK